MSEKRCKDFKSSAPKSCSEIARNHIFQELKKKRQELIDARRFSGVTDPEPDIIAINELIKNILLAESQLIPNFTENDIERIRLDFNKFNEDFMQNENFYEPAYLQYSFENMPVCPYCSQPAQYENGKLFCPKNRCFEIQFYLPVPNIAEIPWIMRQINEHHKTEKCCPYDACFVTTKDSPDILFAQCDACEFLDHYKLL